MYLYERLPVRLRQSLMVGLPLFSTVRLRLVQIVILRLWSFGPKLVFLESLWLELGLFQPDKGVLITGRKCENLVGDCLPWHIFDVIQRDYFISRPSIFSILVPVHIVARFTLVLTFISKNKKDQAAFARQPAYLSKQSTSQNDTVPEQSGLQHCWLPSWEEEGPKEIGVFIGKWFACR